MKKIITAVAAIAMATAMFAMDISGAMKVGNNLFKRSFADGAKSTMLSVGQESGGYWWGTRLQAGISADKAGAQFALAYHGWDDAMNTLFNGNKGTDLHLYDVNVWFTPVDMLKIQLMNAGDHLNNSFVDDKRVMHVDGATQVTLTPVDGLSIVATLANEWIKDDKVQDTGLKAAYTADFGTIGAMMIAKSNFENIQIGAGYAGTFDNVSCFADVAYNLKDKVLGVDGQVTIGADALAVKAFAMYTMKDGADAAAKNDLCARVRLDYALDGWTPYFVFKCDDFIVAEKALKMTFNPGATFNCGAAGLELGVELTVDQATSTSISVPFTVTVGL